MDILEKMKDDDYYYSDKEYVSNSMLNLLNKSPQTLAKFIQYGGKTTPALLEGIKEVASVWECAGIKCKGKVDIQNPITNTIIDIKTTSDKSLSSFRGSSYKYGYHRQAAFYLDGFQAKEFIFVVIEKKSPYNIGVYIAGDDFINHGREQYKQLLTTYEDYFLSNEKEINTYIEKGEL